MYLCTHRPPTCSLRSFLSGHLASSRAWRSRVRTWPRHTLCSTKLSSGQPCMGTIRMYTHTYTHTGVPARTSRRKNDRQTDRHTYTHTHDIRIPARTWAQSDVEHMILHVMKCMHCFAACLITACVAHCTSHASNNPGSVYMWLMRPLSHACTSAHGIHSITNRRIVHVMISDTATC